MKEVESKSIIPFWTWKTHPERVGLPWFEGVTRRRRVGGRHTNHSHHRGNHEKSAIRTRGASWQAIRLRPRVNLIPEGR